MWIYIDVPGYFIVFLTDDKELYGLPGTVHYLIQNKTANVQGYITVNYLFPILQYKVTGRNDNQVTNQHYTPQRDVTVFVDDGGNDICSTCTTVGRKSDAYAASAEGCTDDTRHERLVVQQHHSFCQFLYHGQEKC